MRRLYLGIDVQVQRPCAFAVVDEAGTVVESGWFATATAGRRAFESWAAEYELHMGIDAPRTALVAPRKWYWNGSRNTWREKTASDKGLGRHCEVATKAHNLANPQWTTRADKASDWMKLGFELFRTLEEIGAVYEVFPSASYTMLENDPSLQLTVNFSKVRKGKADMLDAWMAAATVREFTAGRGMELGGGDGLGTIILPRKISNPNDAVLRWPD